MVQITAPTSAKTDSPNNQKLKDGTSPYEDLVEFALNNDASGMDKTISQIETGWETLKPLVRSDHQIEIEGLIDGMDKNRSINNFNALAMDAVVAYSFIVNNLDESQLVVPRAVSMLDYVGFRILVRTSAEQVDWADIVATVSQAEHEWKIIAPDVKRDKALYNTVVVAMQGMREASLKKNLDMMRFAAKVDLELVDLLEYFYEN